MKKVFQNLAFLAPIVMLGCQHPPVTDSSSVKYLPPAGTVLELLEPVTIRARSASAFIQNGEEMGGTGEFYPGCDLWVRDPSDQPQVIEPGNFVVTDIRRIEDCVVLVSFNTYPSAPAHVQLADGMDLSDCRYITRMILESSTQPEVTKLECHQLDDPAMGRHVTFGEIRLTVSPVGQFLHANGSQFPLTKARAH